MAGLDAVGLGLAVIPVVIHFLDSYRNRMSGDDAKDLVLSLRNREIMYMNAVSDLFSACLPQKDTATLLRDLSSPYWHDPRYTQSLEAYLGDDVKELFLTAQRIKETIDKLKEKLQPLADSPNSGRSIDKAKKIVKIFRRGPAKQASLARLNNLVDEFRVLCDHKLRHVQRNRTNTKCFQTLLRHQEHANALYAAIQAGWYCMHSDAHILNLRLESWKLNASNQLECSKSFRFLCSLIHAPDTGNARNKWRYTDVIPLPSTENVETMEEIVEQMESDPTRPDETGERRYNIEDLCQFLAQVEAEVQSSGIHFGVLSDGNGQDFEVCPDEQLLDNDPSVNSRRLSDLQRYGIEKERQDRDHLIRCLYHTVDGHGLVKTSDRIQLALTLSCSLLRLQPTHWIEQYWTSEHIYLVNSPSDSLQPYIQHRFQSSRRNSRADGTYPLTPSLTPTERESQQDFVQNEAFFNLAIVLIELCFARPIDFLQEEQDKGSLLLTTMRLAKRSEDVWGLKYRDAVQGCLTCASNLSAITLNSTHSQREVYQQTVHDSVITPLKEAHTVYARA